MPLGQHMEKPRHKSRKKQLKKPGQWATGVIVLIAGVALASLSLISIEIAFICFGLLALTGFIYSELLRRQNWEIAASFKFKTLKDSQEELAREVVINSKNIDEMKMDIARSQHNMATQNSTEERAPEPKPEPLRAIKPEEFRKALARKPQPPKTRQQIVRTLDDEDDTLSDHVVKELLHSAVHDKKIDTFVQPVVRLPQRQTRFYELYARVRARPGQYIPASRYMPIAEQDNLDQDIDNLLLMHCLGTLRQSADLKNAIPFFINIKTSTLTNMTFMKALLTFLQKNRDLAPRLIFEISQKDFDAMSLKMLDILRGLGKLGCSFSLDHVETLNVDIADLLHFKIRFVKFEAARLNSPLESKAFAEHHRAKRKLEANGIGVIVEKIETEEQMRELLDYDIHYGQGYLFGRPELEGAYKTRTRVRREGFKEDYG